jgi:hypothetical protein
MTSGATIVALREEAENLLAGLAVTNRGDIRKAIDLITRCRLALSLTRDDGLGPWESPELEYALHIAARHNLPRFALICAFEALVIGERSLGALGDTGFLSILA